MIALIKRNLKIYFANKIGVLMSCLGALISFFISLYWFFAAKPDIFMAIIASCKGNVRFMDD